jgi:LacI family transcriptional regulator
MIPRKARIIDIASMAGVSIGTVDRVLHERGEVSEKTKEKVLKIAKDLDYSPNFIAQILKKSRRLHLISLLPEPTEESAFWRKHPQGITRAICELDPFPVTLTPVTFDLSDEVDFQHRTEEVLNLNPDGVLMAPIFKSESMAFCSRLARRHIPFVFVDGFIKETGFLSYTGEDIFQSGRVAGQLADLVTPYDKDILILNLTRNLSNVHHLNFRNKGFMSYFPESGKNKGDKIKLTISDPEYEVIKKEISRIFEKKPGIRSIYISGSKSYKIADCIRNLGINSLNLIGYDLLERNVEHLKSGTIKFLIGQRPEEQTYRGIRKLFEFLAQNKIPQKVEYLPVDVVTSENVKFFI